jgi:hypothetical protein
VISGGTQRTILQSNLVGPQSGPYFAPTFIFVHGWDVTVKKIAGTDRSISWSIRAIT